MKAVLVQTVNGLSFECPNSASLSWGHATIAHPVGQLSARCAQQFLGEGDEDVGWFQETPLAAQTESPPLLTPTENWPWGARRKTWTGYAVIPRLARYSMGLSEPKEILIPLMYHLARLYVAVVNFQSRLNYHDTQILESHCCYIVDWHWQFQEMKDAYENSRQT